RSRWSARVTAPRTWRWPAPAPRSPRSPCRSRARMASCEQQRPAGRRPSTVRGVGAPARPSSPEPSARDATDGERAARADPHEGRVPLGGRAAPGRARPQLARTRPRVGRRAATAALLAALGISALLAVPGLRPVVREIGAISPAWAAVAVALELASCVSFVVLFRLFFDRVPGRDGRPLAWTSMASGALLPGGGVGGLAVGGWLVHLRGASTSWIVRRSSGLFFLTTAVNGAAVIGSAALLLSAYPGPHDLPRAGLPL